MTGTYAPQKIGRNNEVTVLKRVSLHENLWTFLLGGQKSVRNNGVTVLTRWPKAGFHCTQSIFSRLCATQMEGTMFNGITDYDTDKSYGNRFLSTFAKK